MGKVLIGFEYSGITRDAFIAEGHDAISCDLLDTERPGPHWKGNILEPLAHAGWDLIILHPPCTYMAVSGNRWYSGTPEREQAQSWTRYVWDRARAGCNLVALENPVSTLTKVLGPCDDSIQPWQFGHGETKRICWWLHNLPPLKPTNIVEGREARVHRMPPSKERGKLRSRWYPGIAEAEAKQWGALIGA